MYNELNLSTLNGMGLLIYPPFLFPPVMSASRKTGPLCADEIETSISPPFPRPNPVQLTISCAREVGDLICKLRPSRSEDLTFA